MPAEPAVGAPAPWVSRSHLRWRRRPSRSLRLLVKSGLVLLLAPMLVYLASLADDGPAAHSAGAGAGAGAFKRHLLQQDDATVTSDST